MAVEFTDAIVSSALVSLSDEDGRAVSLSFESDALIFHRRRPQQGRKARLTYSELLTIIADRNPNFFDAPKSRRALPGKVP